MSPHLQLMLVAAGVPLAGSLILYYAWRRPGVVLGGTMTAVCAAFMHVHLTTHGCTRDIWVIPLIWAAGIIATMIIIRESDSLPDDNIP